MRSQLAQKLGLQIQKINVDTQKIDVSYLDNFGMVIARFSAEDKQRKIRGFEKTSLLA